jgi:hypothetical protein
MPTTKVASTTPSTFPSSDEVNVDLTSPTQKKEKTGSEALDVSEKQGFPEDDVKLEEDDELDVPAFMRRKK